MSLYHIKMHIKRIKPIKRVYDVLFKAKRNEQEEQRKRAALAAEGMSLVADLEKILQDAPYTYFIAYGNLLGLVREGHFLAHDNDLDYAISVNEGSPWEDLEKRLVANGFTKCRQFLIDGKVHEQSYCRDELTVDFFGYLDGEEYSRWYGFCRRDGYIYDDRYDMHILETHFSPIKSVKQLEFNGVMVTVPADPERFLEDAYGPGWRVPDPTWSGEKESNRIELDILGRLDPCK